MVERESADTLRTDVEPAPDWSGLTLGRRINDLRRQRGWTLDQLSQVCGLSISALSKIENGQVSASFDTIVRITQAFGKTFEDLFRSKVPSLSVSGRRTVTKAGTGIRFSAPSYDYEVHSAELTHKGMIPLVTQVKARKLPPPPEWSRHSGEEFIYVVSGSVELHTEFYAPAVLNVGDSAYIDSAMRHAFLSTSADEATILSICLTESLVFEDVVIGRQAAAADSDGPLKNAGSVGHTPKGRPTAVSGQRDDAPVTPQQRETEPPAR